MFKLSVVPVTFNMSKICFGFGVAVIVFQLERLYRSTLELNARLSAIHDQLQQLTCSKPPLFAQPPSRNSLASTISDTSDQQTFYDLTSAPFPASDSEPALKSGCSELFRRVDATPESCPADAIALLAEFSDQCGEDNVGWLWRQCRAHQMLATQSCAQSQMIDENDRLCHLNTAIEYGLKGVDILNTSTIDSATAGAVHKWLGAAAGCRADLAHSSLTQRLQDARLFSRHVHAALQLRPQDPTLHHMLARFHYQLAISSWWERRAAVSLIFDTTDRPTDLLQSALQLFQQADQLAMCQMCCHGNNNNSDSSDNTTNNGCHSDHICDVTSEGDRQFDWLENRLYIARCLVLEEKRSEALALLQNSVATRVDDPPLDISSVIDTRHKVNELIAELSASI